MVAEWGRRGVRVRCIPKRTSMRPLRARTSPTSEIPSAGGWRRRHPLARFMGRTYVILVSQNRRKYCGMSNAVATSLKVRMAAEDFAFRLGPGPSAMVKRRPHLPPAQRERH